MAKTENSPTTAPAQTGSQFAAIDVSSAPGADTRKIMLNVPMADGSTKQMARNDYIRARASEIPQPDRGQIRAEVSKLGGKEVSYQTIFGATKDLYPKKDSKKAPASEGGAA